MSNWFYICIFACSSTFAAVDIVPYPSKVEERPGAFRLPASKPLASAVKFSKDASIPREGYRLSVTANGIKAAASDKAGAFYALKTLDQLAKSEKGKTSVPCVEIEDSPRYPWRGLHLDESRHFFGKETVEAILDQMARFKLNRFHWHLTDDQGWRLDVPGHPELVARGAWRAHSPKRPDHGGPAGKEKQVSDGRKYGPFFYKEADIKEIIAYAKERHIEVLPEIELPGHFRAVLAAHPEFACFEKNIKGEGARCTWGIEPEVMCAGNDEAIKFVEEVLEYVCGVFPFEAVHIGGDECPKARWKACDKCQARIKAEGLKDERTLQAWVTRHFTEFLARHGKRTVGWSEYLGPGVPADAIGMNWGHSNKARDASNGHDVIVCPSAFCYLNHAPDIPGDPYPYGGGNRTLEKCYSFNPSEGVTGEAESHIIGGQGCQWTEYSWDRNDLEWKYWPRMMALAEVFWLGEKKPGFDDFRRRAAVQRERLAADGVNCGL